VRLTGAGGDGPVPTPEQLAKRPERNAQAHARRAKGRIRRYIRANRCRFMWTFTERADVRDFDEACEHVDAFLRALRETFGRLPFVLVPEPQPGGHAWHWHAATDRKLSIEKMRQCWPYGYVWVGTGQDGRKTMPPRHMARYMSKYLGKQLEAENLPEGFTGRRKNQHRYRLTEGFDPFVVRAKFSTFVAALDWMTRVYGIPTERLEFSIADNGLPDSCWYAFSDKLLHPPPVAMQIDL
jgi:hypothetical protein